MSTLDQAFIRAYQSGPNRAAAARSTSADDRAIHAAIETPTKLPTAPREPLDIPSQSTARKVASDDRRARHFVDAPHSGLPPHYAEEARRVSAAPAAHSAVAQAADVRSSQRSAAAIVVPVESLPVAAESETFRPAFETQRFAWPRQVEVLIAAAGNEFAEFVTELESRSRAGRQTLVVTGVERGEGRTTLVLALARLLANRNLRIAIVDVDVRGPQLADQLGLRPELGWDDVYAEHLSAADAMIESLDDRVTLLPMRNALANPRALAGNAMWSLAVEELQKNFDIVLFDIGPLADDQQTIDAAAVLGGSKFDDALVVRDRRRTAAKHVHEVCRRLGVLGIRHWDIAENFTEVQSYDA